MRRLNTAALLAALCLAPAAAQAQKVEKAERQAGQKVTEILTEFNGEIRGYERELKYFQRVPDAKPLLDLRKEMVAQGVEMEKLDAAGRSGPRSLSWRRR